jgi:hypothetical protein
MRSLIYFWLMADWGHEWKPINIATLMQSSIKCVTTAKHYFDSNAKRELALFEKDLVATLKRSWKGEGKHLGRLCVAGRTILITDNKHIRTHLISHTNEGTVRNRLHSCHHPSDIMRLVPIRIWQLDVF